MKVFHITNEGKVRPCNAKPTQCPFLQKGVVTHFSNQEDAFKALEKMEKEKNNLFPTSNKINMKSMSPDDFESYVAEQLSINFPEYDFQVMGGADSTVSDILVKNKKGETIFIEVKKSQAQCGQTVLSHNIKKGWKFNDDKYDSSLGEVIELANIADPSSKYIDVSESLDEKQIADFVIGHYKKKNAKAIISFYDNRLTAFAVKDILNHVNLSACIRRKASGSQGIPDREKEYWLNKIDDAIDNDGKIFIPMSDRTMYEYNGRRYMAAPRKNGMMEIRKLSETKNMTFIVSFATKRGNYETWQESIKKVFEKEGF